MLICLLKDAEVFKKIRQIDYRIMLKNPKNKKVLKWLLVAGGSLLLIGFVVYFYFATLSHDDTASLKADYTVEAIPFIK